MSASVTRSLTDSVNTALRKVTINVDGIKATAVDAKQSSEAATRAAASNAQAISNALAQIKALEDRIATLEQSKATTQ